MPSLRRKFKLHMTKWCAMFKRRSPSGEKEPQSPRQPKQQRLMATAGFENDQNSVSCIAAFACPPSTVPSTQPTVNTASAPSSSTSGSMGNPQSHGSTTAPEVGAPGSSATNPIDLTETADTNCSSNTLIEFTGQPEPAGPASPIPATMSIDEQRSAQIQNDRAVAQLLQEEFDRGGDYFQGTESVDNSFAQLDEITDFWRRLQNSRCANCNTSINVEVLELIRRTRQLLNETHFFHPCFFCASCRGWSCIGGDTYHATDWVPTLKHVVSAETFKATWCCDHGRLFLIFSLLCGHEPPAGPAAPAPKKARKPRSKSEPSAGPVIKGRASRKSQLSKGTGYGDSIPNVLSTRGRADTSVGGDTSGNDTTNDMLELYFQALARLLPSATRGNTSFDCFPQAVVTAMMWRSPMLQHASECLRQAAIEEISARSGLITAVLDFVETLGSHFNMCPVLLRPRTLFPPSEQLISAALGQAKNKNAPGAAEHESTQSLAAIVEHLAVPCRTFQKFSKLGNIDGEDGETTLAVVQRICKMADWLGSLRSQLAIEETQDTGQPSTSTTQSSRSSANVTTRGMVADAAKKAEAVEHQETTKAAAEWHRANCVKEVPDETILRNFHYKDLALAAGTSRPASHRMRKLLAQVASLSTDLPDGIYVRHGESRLDVLKILIVGPTGTPYEHGLFEFDMFCPSEFPQKPPAMFFRTTGGGLVSFNPNLYSNGKVCLSLLGTWSGHPWEPHRSTILQILVSIQAMIFNHKPFYNEPGYEMLPEDGRSEQYNRDIEHRTVEYALLGWMAERLVSPDSKGPAAKPSTSADSGSKPSVQATTAKNNNPPSSMAGPAHPPSAPTPGPDAVNPPAPQFHSQHFMGNIYSQPPGAVKAQVYPVSMPHTQAHPGFAINTAAHGHPASAIVAQPHQGALPATQAHAGNKTAAQAQSLNPASTYTIPNNPVSAHTPQGIPTAYQPYPPHPSIYDLAADDFLMMEAPPHFDSAGVAGTSQMSGGIHAMDHHDPTGLWHPATFPSALPATAPFTIPPQSLPVAEAVMAQQLAAFRAIPRPPRPAPQPPREDDPIWGDVIRKHFELKGKMIVETVTKWEKLAAVAKVPRFRKHQNPMTGAAGRVMEQLARHGFDR